MAIRRFLPLVLLCLGLVASQAGCVQRRLTIRSNPPGALVYVDDYQIGITPISTNFTYYGTRKIRLVKDGYETLTVMQDIPPPWYEFVPIDFVTENVIPGEIRDHRLLEYRLTPQMIVPTDQLLQRAEQLRRGSQPGLTPGTLAAPGVRYNQGSGNPPPFAPGPITPVPVNPPGTPGIGGQAAPLMPPGS